MDRKKFRCVTRGWAQFSELSRLCVDDVENFVLVLAHHHPRVACVRQTGDGDVELSLCKCLWEGQERNPQRRYQIGFAGLRYLVGASQ